MSHLDIIRDAYDRVGILYVVRTVPRSGGKRSYLFLATEEEREELETGELACLLVSERWMEFEDGELASW